MSTSPTVPSARDEVRQVVPRLIELTETLLHPDIGERPFYAGRPSAMSGARVAKQVLEGRPA